MSVIGENVEKDLDPPRENNHKETISIRNLYEPLLEIENPTHDLNSDETNRSKSTNNAPKISRRQKKPTPGNISKINIIYVKPQGITGKINSLAAVAKASDAQVIGLAETKLGTPPRYQGTPGITNQEGLEVAV